MIKWFKNTAFFLIFCMLSEFALATITISATGSLARNTDALQEVEFLIKITGGKLAFSSAEDLNERLGIALGSGTKTLAHIENYVGDEYEVNYWTEVSLVDNGIDNTTNTLTTQYKVILRANSTYQISDLVSSNELAYKVYYYEWGEDGTLNKSTPAAKDEGLKLVRLAEVPSSSPEIQSVAASHQQLTVTWATPATIVYSSGSSYETPSVNVIVISTPETEVSLVSAAYTFNPGSPYEDTALASDLSCSFVPDFSGEEDTCSIECPENTYLLMSKLKGIAQASLSKSAGLGSSSLSLDNLENGTKYAVIAYYANDGVGFSRCFFATPVRNFTMTEASGEDEAKKSDISCFIATAAYGSPWTQELVLLRWFRDQYLLSFSLGKKFVHLYYAYSPKLAGIIADSPVLRSLTRGVLTPLVYYIAALKKMPFLTLFLSFLACLGTVAVFMGGRQKFLAKSR